MPKRIILLTGELEGPHLSGLLQQHNPDLAVDIVQDSESLSAACAHDMTGCRLIAFLTSVIVPADVLTRLEGPAYNFHPGPPEFPGSYVAGFAIYDGAKTFGVTLHEMAAAVDSGPIVEVRRFPIAEKCKFQELEVEAFRNVLQMFADYAPHLARDDAPLPRCAESWTGQVRTRREAKRLQQIEADLTEEEIVRRYRAFG